MKLYKLFLTLLLVGAVSSISAQELVVIGGVKYAIHDVAKGETLYSLARKYGTTIDDIVKANEVLAQGLKAGQRIKIPFSAPAQPAEQQVVERNTKKRGADEVVAPQTEAPQTEVLQSVAPQAEASQAEAQVAELPKVEPISFRTLKNCDRAEVALLLPLGSEAKPSQNYLDFYRGFLVGLDSVRMAGYSVNLNLYNTAHDYNRVSDIVASGALKKADLVVGPVYEDELIPVAAALREKGTPIVSPLANLTQTISSAVFQMSPSPATKLDKVRNMFDGSKRVVIISTDNVDKEFDAEVRSMLRDTSYVVEHKYIYEHPSIIEKREKEREKMRAEGLEVDETPSPSDMSPLLRGETPSVIVITADNEIEVDRILAAIASANIALTARSQRVVPFVVYGNNRWNRYRNIDRAILFTNRVTMLSTYHARRSEPIIKAFDKRFVEEFGALPSLYAYRGYDAAVVFVKALYGAMETGLEGAHTKPLLTPYSFEPNSANGLRINNQWIKVNYNSNFTITTE